MAIINRVTRLFRADFHAVLDRIEEPEQLLRQSLREMEEAFAADQLQLHSMENEQQQLQHRLGSLQSSLDELESQLDLCFDSGKEALARSLVRRKLGLQQQCKQFTERSQQLLQAKQRLAVQLQENHNQLESLRQKVDLLTPLDGGLDTPRDGSLDEVAIADTDVEVAFLQEQRKRRST